MVVTAMRACDGKQGPDVTTDTCMGAQERGIAVSYLELKVKEV